jgi:general stress protein 26
MNAVPESFHDLLAPEAQAFAVLLTHASPQSPLMTMMWFSVDGEHILFNSVPTSRKHKNIVANPSIHFMIIDPTNMYRYLEIAGTVIEVTQEGANEHNQYLAAEKYGWDDGSFGTNRVMYRVQLDKVRGVE